jgi:hypothetical protein
LGAGVKRPKNRQSKRPLAVGPNSPAIFLDVLPVTFPCHGIAYAAPQENRECWGCAMRKGRGRSDIGFRVSVVIILAGLALLSVGMGSLPVGGDIAIFAGP